MKVTHVILLVNRSLEEKKNAKGVWQKCIAYFKNKNVSDTGKAVQHRKDNDFVTSYSDDRQCPQ